MNEIRGPLFLQEAEIKLDSFYCRPISEEHAKIYLVELFTAFLRSYKLLVESNFLTFANKFKLYEKFPSHMLLELGARTNRGPRTMTGLSVYFVRSATDECCVEVVDGTVRILPDGAHIEHRGTRYELLRCSKSTIDYLFHSNGQDTNLKDMTLRRLVYDQLRDDLVAVEIELRKKYGRSPGKPVDLTATP